MWAQAVAKAGTTAVDPVREAMYGQKVDAPCGYTLEMHRNHHLSKPVMIGEVMENGQFNIVWKTSGPIIAENWSPFIPENASRRR
jgi:urea transport system substrate-binding protein